MKKISEYTDEELNKALLAEAKPIEAVWTLFRESTMGPDTSQDVIDDRRVIWFHAAWRMYTLLIDTAKKGTKEEIKKLGDLVHEEMKEFSETRKRQQLIDKMKVK